jgi:hypothetical protein
LSFVLLHNYSGYKNIGKLLSLKQNNLYKKKIGVKPIPTEIVVGNAVK